MSSEFPSSLRRGGMFEKHDGVVPTYFNEVPEQSKGDFHKDTYEQVLRIIDQIQSSGTSIAPAYGNWRTIGFAFANEFGESGRHLFHRIGENYPDYNLKETDQQYSRCINTSKHGVTIDTFFYWAHRNGLIVDYNTIEGNPISPSSNTASRKVNPSNSSQVSHSSAQKQNKPIEASENYQKVLEIISQIESTQTDIAPQYIEWRNIGFAFADEFGEAGRELFHRMSRFYPDYTTHEADNQYTRCLKSKGHGVTIGTFFYWSFNAGISPNPHYPHSNPHFSGKMRKCQFTLGQSLNSQKQPPILISSFPQHPPIDSSLLKTFPGSIFTHIPPFLKKVVDICTTDQERDLMLLGSLVSLGASLFNIYGIYDSQRVYPNLYLFVSAPASSGKGRLLHCRNLLVPLHQQMRQQHKLQWNQYQLKIKNLSKEESKSNPVPRPPEQLMFIPANTSATGMFQLLADNPRGGLIFETEGDTLTQTFKSDYGNYSDGFRKAFHHEPISFFRRMDREYVNMESPRLSAILSGTPNQVATLIPDIENGLFSRFIFYDLEADPSWKNVFELPKGNSLDQLYLDLGKEWAKMHEQLQKKGPIYFYYSSQQQKYFNQYLTNIQEELCAENGETLIPTIRRMGTIVFRFSMILSSLRMAETDPIPSKIQCNNNDFKIALSLARPLLNNALDIHQKIIGQPGLSKNRKYLFWESLPGEFNRQTYIEIAKNLSIPPKTAERYIAEAIKIKRIQRKQKDHYLTTA